MVNMFKTLLLFTFFTTYIPHQSNRLLLIFADKASNPAVKQQQKLLKADAQGLIERDLEVHYYYADRDIKMFEDNHIRTGFTVILVGKDGDDKLREFTPIPLKKLFGTIDAMPMRKDEMEQASKVSVL